MKTKLFKLFILTLAISLVSCKKENTLSESDYKFADKGIVLTCENVNSKLYSEALFAFENDILSFYSRSRPKTSLLQAYSQFIRNTNLNRVKYEDIVSTHTVKIFEALKNEKDLWDANNPKSNLNYNGPLIKCIAINMQNKDLKTTLNALISTNSMSPILFGRPLLSNINFSTLINDKYLSSYVAFDMFYANLFNKDLSKVNDKKPEQKVDFNKRPQ